MSQEQPRRPQEAERQQQEPIKYGDLFQVSGELADKPVAPADAAMMQAAETTVLGQTQKGGPAAVMQAAATRNEMADLVGHRDVTDIAAEEGVTVEETELPGSRIITETVAGQVVGKSIQAKPTTATEGPQSKITIGEALEASARTAGDKPVDHSDAAAIMAAECRATGSNLISPGGLAATAQSAAAFNDGLIGDQGKVKLADILTGARAKLPADKAATREDAEGIMAAELRSDPNLLTMHPGGVAAAVAQAVGMNEMAPARMEA
ncbi:late embryogenesis abundant protein d-34 [Phtheirospermum japonicum]|uniref:Late embryogenesis abundant protein d-34 n=1 Tax=Phtheirospermum japonicum TaxID=374723 RepID=A0A830BFI9_9LAMI|nr:late embryogenesis abundant protein d-34 [Phtheirospermum japonicum]